MGTDHAAVTGTTSHGLYTDIRGDAAAPALLFLHGGPGQGCHDFMALQGDLLAASVRLIGLDQRGVDRSAPLPQDAALSIADLVEDCEAVREELGIERWAVLGQSFGGALALRYAAAHPAAVAAVAFENPVWDLAASARAALPRVALMLTERGRQEAALAALAAAAREDSAALAARRVRGGPGGPRRRPGGFLRPQPGHPGPPGGDPRRPTSGRTARRATRARCATIWRSSRTTAPTNRCSACCRAWPPRRC